MTPEQQIDKLRKAYVTNAIAKQKKLTANAASVLSLVRKAHGKDSMRLFESTSEVDLPCYSTGRQEFDDWLTGADVMGGGVKEGSGRGFPKGRIVEIFGPESSGKSSLMLFFIAAVQQQGGLAGYVDVEHAFDPVWARKLGADPETLLLSQPTCAEEAIDIAIQLVASRKLQLVVVDSVAALVPKKELEGDMERTGMGEAARIMSKAMRKLTSLCAKTGCTIIFVNQIRMKLGVMFGNPETTPGGNALKFFSSVRIDVRRIKFLMRPTKVKLKDGKVIKKDKPYAILTRAKTIKNKVASPQRETKFIINFENGIGEIGEHL